MVYIIEYMLDMIVCRILRRFLVDDVNDNFVRVKCLMTNEWRW
jgi:hypothetical protein